MKRIDTELTSALLSRMAALDVGPWTEDAVGATVAELGFGAVADGRFDTPTGVGIVVPAPDDRTSPILAVRVPLGPATGFGDAVQVAGSVIGYPPPILGGPDTFARWIRPVTLDKVGTSIGLIATDDQVWAELVATMTWENWAYDVFNWGRASSTCRTVGWRSPLHPSLRGMTTGGRVVKTWSRSSRVCG
ncbi:hypothetical protein ACFQX7_30515 [Luedemannella flava]